MASTGQSDDEGFIKWGVRLDSLQFNTKVFTEMDGQQSDVEDEALARLITALQTGEITPIWKTSADTREDIHSEARYVYSQVCTHCNTYTEQKKREIVVDDGVGFVCPGCVDKLRDICNECKRHRDDFNEDDSMEIVGRTVVEFLCSTCYENGKQTEV